MTVAQDVLLTRVEDGIATLTINRPHRRNAMNQELYRQMPKLVADLEADDSVRVVIVRGAGEEAFAAGADISEFEESRSTPEKAKAYNELSGAASDAVERMKKPTIAMIYGFAMGGGCQLAACCDLRFAAEDAQFGIPAGKLGLAIGLGYSQRMVNLVGPGYAKEILFTGRRFTAPEGLQMGFFNRVLPRAELEKYTYDTAQMIAQNAPFSIQSAKQSVEIVQKNPSLEGVDGHALFGWIFGTDDFAEGTRAFLEKRLPVFRGK